MNIFDKATLITTEQYMELAKSSSMNFIGQTAIADNTYFIIWKHEDGTLYKTYQKLIGR